MGDPVEKSRSEWMRACHASCASSTYQTFHFDGTHAFFLSSVIFHRIESRFNNQAYGVSAGGSIVVGYSNYEAFLWTSSDRASTF